MKAAEECDSRVANGVTEHKTLTFPNILYYYNLYNERKRMSDIRRKIKRRHLAYLKTFLYSSAIVRYFLVNEVSEIQIQSMRFHVNLIQYLIS